MVIYRIYNKINGKSYIGQTKQPFDVRIKQHFYMARRGKRKSPIHSAIFKYGEESFDVTIIHECSSFVEMDELEIYYIKHYDSLMNFNGYNLSGGGSGNHGLCVESRKKISDAVSGEKHPQWGKRGPGTPMYGKKHTQETKDIMRLRASGEGNSQYGKKQTDEHKRKRFDHLKTQDHHRAKKFIIVFPDGHEEEIISLNRFCIDNGLRRSSMSMVASGKYKQHKGFKCRRV